MSVVRFIWVLIAGESHRVCDAMAIKPDIRRPRWPVLYGLVGLMAVAEFTVAMLVPAGLVANVVQGAIGIATLAAAAGWVCANRVTLDLEHWCACASEQTTVRVILSRRLDAPPAVAAPPIAPIPVGRVRVDVEAPVA